MYVDPTHPQQAPDVYVGEALVQPSLNRITVEGRTVQVEPKVMHVLTCLTARPGEVMARDQLLEQVWDDTVAYDYMLNRAVSELRKIFDDDARHPRVIETIRKTGYRLIAPVAFPPTAGDGQAADAGAPLAAPSRPTPADRPDAQRGTPRWTLVLGGLLLALAAGAMLAYQHLQTSEASLAATYDVVPLTSLAGREHDPAPSPDGNHVAFAWDGSTAGDFDLYVKPVGSEALLALADGPGDERYPAWSPDGQRVAFVRSDGQASSIYVVSAVGGPARRLVDCRTADPRGLAWSPDGQWLAYADRTAPDAPLQIHLFSLARRQAHALTTPPGGTLGDIMPAFSPDSRTLVFVRAVSEVVKDLFRIPVEGGTPAPITFDHRKISGVAWAADGHHLLYTSTRSGMYRVWSVPVVGGEPRLVPLGFEDVQALSAASPSPRIVFENWTFRSSIHRLELRGSAQQAAAAPFKGSTRWDSHPAYAPDGSRIAFTSNRSGPPGIWVSQPDGTNAIELVNMEGAFTDHPRWSPDGRLIAFDASPDGQADIYLIDARGGSPRRITTDEANDQRSSWSADGRWIYFDSNRSGRWEVWALPVAGGPPVQITHHGGANAFESPDGRWLYYTKPNADGLWRRPRIPWEQAGPDDQEERVLEAPALRDAGNWAVTQDGIYFVRRPEDAAPSLAFFNVQDETIRNLAPLNARFEGAGLTVSPDGANLLYAEQERPASDLQLAEPMR